MENGKVLAAERVDIDFSGLKIPKNLGGEDASILDMFRQLAPYYWCRTQDLPSDIKLLLGINRWGSIFHAINDLSKMPKNPRLSRVLSAGINSIQSRL